MIFNKGNKITSTTALGKLESALRSGQSTNGFDELKNLADQAVDASRSGKEEDLLANSNLTRSLELRGDLLRDVGDYDAARTDFIEALGLMSGSPDADEGIGRICASMALIHESQGENEQAKSFYERAISAFERLTPPAVVDLANLSNNLAFLYEAEGDFDRAETFLLNALRSCYDALGENDPQTSALFNNVGTLYFKADYLDRAEEMHAKALAGRQKTFGEKHPETAQSHGNLALIFFKKADYETAEEHFEKSLAGFEQDLESSRDDYLIVAANYQDALSALGKDTKLQELKERLANHS